ncbi:MAG: hypothetical protein EA001_07910 [Oscillatoriales cyanobacterium]|nr:MAG: hypothetical protein EA001_07910 [Oscillatoriales cyanobacterium]
MPIADESGLDDLLDDFGDDLAERLATGNQLGRFCYDTDRLGSLENCAAKSIVSTMITINDFDVADCND